MGGHDQQRPAAVVGGNGRHRSLQQPARPAQQPRRRAHGRSRRAAWAGTNGSLLRPERRAVQHVERRPGFLSDDYVRALAEGRDSSLWVRHQPLA